MEKFKFFVDRKITLWTRTEIYVHGKTQKHAKERLIRDLKLDSDNIYDYMDEGEEYLFDTEDTMTPKQNGNRATLEVYEKNTCSLENRIYSNEEL